MNNHIKHGSSDILQEVECSEKGLDSAVDRYNDNYADEDGYLHGELEQEKWRDYNADIASGLDL